MIPCQSCGNQNPIGTRYCRKCGTKIEVQQGAIVEAVERDNADLSSQRWLERGRSALIIGLFFLTCGLVLRFSIVPPMPAADVPPVEIGPWLPDELPKKSEPVEGKEPAKDAKKP